jgi:hypothetical protein
MCCVYQGLSDVAIESGQAYIEASLKEESSANSSEIHFGIDCFICRQSDPHFVSRNPHSADETCRPTRGEKLFRVGAGSGMARRRQRDIQTAIVTPRRAIAASCCMDPGGVENLFEFRHRDYLSREMNSSLTPHLLHREKVSRRFMSIDRD